MKQFLLKQANKEKENPCLVKGFAEAHCTISLLSVAEYEDEPVNTVYVGLRQDDRDEQVLMGSVNLEKGEGLDIARALYRLFNPEIGDLQTVEPDSSEEETGEIQE